MTTTGSVTEKIQTYINSHPDSVGKPLSEISAELISLGVVTQEEISLLDSKSTFSILHQNSEELENEDSFLHSDDVEDSASDNLSVKTRVAANDDEIVEKRNGEELVEKIIKQKTENSEEVKITTIKYSKGKPVSKKVTNDSGDVLEDYSYTKVVLPSGEEAYSIVKLDGNGDAITQDVVSDIDENGDYKSGDFKSRIKVFLKDTVLPNGITVKSGSKQVVQNYNGKIIESVVDKTDEKVINTLYNGNSITEYDNGNLNRLFQEVQSGEEVQTVNYDGKGNTRVVIRNNDGFESITKYFNSEIDRRGLDASHHFTQADLEALNPKEANRGLQVGQTILVPSEYNANAPILVNRGTQKQALSEYTQVVHKQTIDRLYASTIDELTLSRNYGSYEELVRETLRKQGVANPTAAQLNDRANELIILNQRTPLKKGLKVKIVSGQSSAADMKALNSAGFKQTPENNLFYTKFNSLDSDKKQQVLSVLKGYPNETDLNKLKAMVYEITGVNLYNTSLTVNEHKQGSIEAGFYNSSIPLEYFITNRLGLDLNSATGKEVYLRLRSLPQEQLNNISASQFAPSHTNQFGMPNNKISVGSDATLQTVISAMAGQGVELRTSDEIRIDESNPRFIARRKKEEAISFLYHSVNAAYSIINSHLDELKSHMFSNLGEIMLEDIKHYMMPDSLKKLIDIAGIKNGTVDGLMKSIFNKLDELSDTLMKISQLRTSSNFERDYKAITGCDYDPDNVHPFLNHVENAQGFVQTSSFGGNIVEMAAMIYLTAGMGEIGFIKNSGAAVEALTGSRALGMGTRGALTLGTYTTARESLNLIDDFKNSTSLSSLAGAIERRGIQIVEHSGQSALFGFVGGASAQKLFNLSKGAQNFMTNQFSKVFGKGGNVVLSDGAAASSSQVFTPSIEAVAAADNVLAKGAALSGSELMSKVTEKTLGLNWFGKATNLLLEVSTFAGLEITEQAAAGLAKEIFTSESELKQAIANNTLDEYLTEKIQNAPEEMWEHFKEQGINLLMLKAVSYAIGAHSVNSLKGQYETLDNSKIYKTVIDGQPKAVVETSNGKLICNSTSEALSFLHQAMTIESMMRASSEGLKSEPVDAEYTDVTTQNQVTPSGDAMSLPIYSRSSLPLNTTVMSSTNLVISKITGEPIGRFLPPSSHSGVPLGFTESQVLSLSAGDISLDAVRNQFYAAVKPLSEPTVSLSDIKNVMDVELLPDITGNVNYDNAVNIRRQQIANRNFVISQLDACRAANQDVFANNVNLIRNGIGEKQNIKALEEGVIINLYENGMISDVDVKNIFSQGSGLISRADFDYFARKKIPLTEFDNPEIIELRYINSTGQVLKIDSDYYREVKDKIIAEEKPKIEKAKSEGKMIIVTGLPGAGKSTVVRNSLGEDVLEDYYSPDADAFKAEFSEYYLEGKGSDLVHKASTTVLKQEIMPLVLEEKKNIIYQTTGGEETLNKIIQNAKDNGYDVEIIHVNVAPERSMERALGRLHKEGRFLDPYITLGISNEGRFNPNDIPDVMSNDVRVDRIRVYDTNGSKPTHIRDIEINSGANNGSSGVELDTSPFKPTPQPKQVTQAEVFKIPEVLTDNELNLRSSDLVEVVGGKKVLTPQGEELVTKMAKQINKIAQEKESSVIQMVKNAGFADGAKFTFRSKSVSSLHDKIQNALFDNDNITLEGTLDEVKDSEGVRTLFEEKDYSSHPEVQELLSKGDREGAIRRAVELQSNSTYEALKRYIDSVADGTNEFEITRISNYMGKDGIPYFTESQLSSIKAYADSKGVKIPIVERVTIKEETDGSRTVTVNKKSTTKVRGSGYTALQMNGRTKDGFVFESQNRAGKVDVFAEAEHVPYDLRTGKDIVGNHPELANIYAPMQRLLIGENKISDEMFDEHSAYLTAHYEYLRLTELGFEDGTNPPKFPRGLDARLRAENLELLHEYVEKIKAEPEREAELRAEYESKLVQNTPENTTEVRYNKVEPKPEQETDFSSLDAELKTRMGAYADFVDVTVNENNSALIRSILDLKGPNGDPYPDGLVHELVNYMTMIPEEKLQLANKLFNMREPDDSIRFGIRAISQLCGNNYPMEDVERLAEIKSPDGKYRYSAQEIMDIIGAVSDGVSRRAPGTESYTDVFGNSVDYTMSIRLDEGSKVFDGSVKVVKDSDGNLLYKEQYRPSADVEGKFDIVRTDANSNEWIVGLASKSVNGNQTIIEKTLFGTDNTKTDYVYLEDSNGRLSYSKITDSEGNVILNNSRKFKQIDENHYLSVENGVEYDIQYFEDKIVVTSQDGNRVELPIVDNGEAGISRDLIPLMKQLPGSALMDIDKFKLEGIAVSYDIAYSENAFYSPEGNVIVVSPELSGEEFVFTLLHELGHMVDYNTNIHGNAELLAIYEAERNALLESGAFKEFNELKYFTTFVHKNKGGAITEMIAETNALLHSNADQTTIEARGALLQQYFPKTFAKITELLGNVSVDNDEIDFGDLSFDPSSLGGSGLVGSTPISTTGLAVTKPLTVSASTFYKPETITKINDFLATSTSDEANDYVTALRDNLVDESVINDFLSMDESAQNRVLAEMDKTAEEISGVIVNQSDMTIQNPTTISIAYSLVLMKIHNPESFNKLVDSKGFKAIKTGELNLLLLQDIKATDTISDNYFYEMFDVKERDLDAALSTNPKFQDYDSDLIKKIIDLDPARQDEILNYILIAADKSVMQNILTLISQRLTKSEQRRADDETVGVFTRQTEIRDENNKLIDLIRLAAENPQAVMTARNFRSKDDNLNTLIEKIIDTKLPADVRDRVLDLFQAAHNNFGNVQVHHVTQGFKFMEEFNDIALLEKLLSVKQEENIEAILKNITENNIDIFRQFVESSNPITTEQLSMLAVLKDYPESKTLSGATPILAAMNDIMFDVQIGEGKNYYSEVLNRTGLIEIKVKDPAKYARIEDSGLLDMVNSGQIDSAILKQLNINSDLSPELYADLAAVKNGDSIVAEFREGTTLPYAFSKTNVGDVVEIGSKMYLNDGNGLVEWNMTKEKYLELFPPVLRFASKQRRLGDCYFVSSLASSMQNPLARLDIYKSFELQGDDVVVRIKDYEEYGGARVFKNGAIELDSRNMHIYGAKGLQMYEQTYARMALREDYNDPTPALSDATPSHTLMSRIRAGCIHVAMSEIHALKNYGYQEDIPADFTTGTIGITNINKAKFETLLNEYFGKPNVMLGFGTKAKKNSDAESEFLPEYNLVSSHAYSIVGYDPVAQTVTINNPHSSGINTVIPLDKLCKYVSDTDITVL